MVSNFGPPAAHLLEALMDKLQDAVFAIENERFLFFNQRLVELLDCPEDELRTRRLRDFVHPEDYGMVVEQCDAGLSGDEGAGVLWVRLVNHAGDTREVHIRSGVVRGDGDSVTLIGSIRDLTEENDAMRALASSRADIDSILGNMPDVFYRTDMQGIVRLMSPSIVDTLGYRPEEMLGRPLADFYYNPDDRAAIVQALIDGKGKARQVEASLRHKDGSPAWISTNAYVRYDADGQPLCIEGIARNISERKQMEDRLTDLSKYDDLTGCYNRRTFMEESARQVDQAVRYQRPLSMAMLDLDLFKTINDHHGHQVGDQALRYFADACRAIFRKTDLIGRMGGEEFALLMPETSLEKVADMLARLREALQQSPMRGAFGELQLQFSAGVVSKQAQETDPEMMLSRADRLLYQAKAGGRDQVVKESLAEQAQAD